MFLWALPLSTTLQQGYLLPSIVKDGTCIAAPGLADLPVNSKTHSMPPRGAGVRKIQRVHRPVALRRGKQVGIGHPAFLHGSAVSPSDAQTVRVAKDGFRAATLSMIRKHLESPVLSFAVVLMLDLIFFLSVLSLFVSAKEFPLHLFTARHRGRRSRADRA